MPKNLFLFFFYLFFVDGKLSVIKGKDSFCTVINEIKENDNSNMVCYFKQKVNTDCSEVSVTPTSPQLNYEMQYDNDNRISMKIIPKNDEIDTGNKQYTVKLVCPLVGKIEFTLNVIDDDGNVNSSNSLSYSYNLKLYYYASDTKYFTIKYKIMNGLGLCSAYMEDKSLNSILQGHNTGLTKKDFTVFLNLHGLSHNVTTGIIITCTDQLDKVEHILKLPIVILTNNIPKFLVDLSGMFLNLNEYVLSVYFDSGFDGKCIVREANGIYENTREANVLFDYEMEIVFLLERNIKKKLNGLQDVEFIISCTSKSISFIRNVKYLNLNFGKNGGNILRNSGSAFIILLVFLIM